MGKETQAEREERRESELQEETWIRCSGCGQAITRARARIEVEGKHVHTFVNPAGFEYTIRCFAEAPGCVGAGEESTFWSWFRGFAWRMAACAGCGAHVGWSFRKEESVFWGLVVDRITG
ncbi:MAG TPA: cereblon family protein [Polyangiaceae bacterium]|nr:cereblon family protein [Polyangiaceae bacterium]